MNESVSTPNKICLIQANLDLILAVKEKAGPKIQGDHHFRKGEMSASGVVEWLCREYLNPEGSAT